MSGGSGTGAPVEVTLTDYISLGDAEIWIAANILDVVNWTAATDAQKQIALTQAMDHIDQVVLEGIKVDTDQVREFPRCFYSETGEPWSDENMDYLLGAGWYCQSEVPQRVKDAVCYEAIEILNHFLDSDKKERIGLQRQGVLSVRYGDTSESYKLGAGTRYRDLLSKDAQRLMKRYLAGHVPIS